MKKLIAILIAAAAIIGLHLSTAHAACNPVSPNFPNSLDTFQSNDCVPSATFNAMESKIGINGSNVTSSLDYLANHAATINNITTSSFNLAGAGGLTVASSGNTITFTQGAASFGSTTSTASTYIFNFNTKYQFPSPTQLAAGAWCGISYPDYDAGQCHNDIYSWMASSSEIDYGSYRYNYSVPIINNTAGKYIYDKGVGGGGTVFSFTPNYFTFTAINTSTKVITYATTTALLPFTGETLTYVPNNGASAGLVKGTLYYVGNLNTSTKQFVLYKNALLTTTSSPNGSEAGVLATPAWTYDIGQNPSYGWGADGITLNGPGNGSSTGWYYGGSQGARSSMLAHGMVQSFYYNIYVGDNTYFWTMNQVYSHNNAPNPDGGLLWNDAIGNTGEQMNMIQSVFADAYPITSSTALSHAVHLQTSGFVDWECIGTSFDDVGLYLDWYDGEGNTFNGTNCHWENPGALGASGGGWTAYVPISTNSGNPNNSVSISLTNSSFLNDGNNGSGSSFTNMMQIGPGVKVSLNGVTAQANTYTGASTVTDFATIAAGSSFTSTGFQNLGDTPGVTYMYNTRSANGGYISNVPSFIDSTEQVTGNFTAYNSLYFPPTVSTVSSTLPSYAPMVQVCNATSSIAITLPTVVNNTGETFIFKNRGTATCVITPAGSDLLWLSTSNASGTTYTLNAGSSTAIVNDATYWDQLWK
jgi:hypothetical protein